MEDNKIIDAGTFILELQSTGHPAEEYTKTQRGKVFFKKQNTLEYQYHSTVTKDGKTAVVDKIQTYIYSAKKKRFVRNATRSAKNTSHQTAKGVQ